MRSALLSAKSRRGMDEGQAYLKHQGHGMAGGHSVAFDHAVEEVFAAGREVLGKARIEGGWDLEVGIAGLGVHVERSLGWRRRCGSCRDSMVCGRH